MNDSRSDTILFRNTMKVSEGHLAEFEQAIERAVTFVKENGPQLMVEVFIDRENMLAYSYQLYKDSESIRTHWRMSDPYIQGVMEHCTVERFEVYGQPDANVLHALQSNGQFPVTFIPRLTGFLRLLSMPH